MSKELLTVFDRLYQSRVGAKYPVNGGKDGRLLKDLRAIYSDEDIQRYMAAFFQMEDDFFAQAGWSLGCFRSCLPRVIAFVNRKGSVAVNLNAVDRVGQPWWHERCPHDPKCPDFRDCRLLQRGERAS